MPTSSKYEITLTVVDQQPGRSRAKAKAETLECLQVQGVHPGQVDSVHRLADKGFDLVSTRVAEVVES